MFATKWKHEEKSCRDTQATVHDSYSSVVQIDSSSVSTVATGKKRVVTVTFLMETEKRQRGNSFATIGKGGGAKVLFAGTVIVFLKLPPAACTILGYEINLRRN